jgi:hypothetical protein
MTQRDERKRTTRLGVERLWTRSKLGVHDGLQDKSRGDLLTIWLASGIKMA